MNSLQGREQEGMTPFQLLTSYADTAVLEGALKENDRVSLPHYLMFMADEKGFLIGLSDVSSVIRDKPVIKPLPFSPAWLRGLSSVRNEIVSVISFSQLFSGSTDHGRQRKEKHYILLNGAMEGFLLEVDKLFGIRLLTVQDKALSERFIDGDVTVDGTTWQRINLDALLATQLNKKMEF